VELRPPWNLQEHFESFKFFISELTSWRASLNFSSSCIKFPRVWKVRRYNTVWMLCGCFSNESLQQNNLIPYFCYFLLSKCVCIFHMRLVASKCSDLCKRVIFTKFDNTVLFKWIGGTMSFIQNTLKSLLFLSQWLPGKFVRFIFRRSLKLNWYQKDVLWKRFCSLWRKKPEY